MTGWLGCGLRKANQAMPKTHHMKLRNEPFKATQEGKKTIEVRLWDDKRQQISVGDFLIFDDQKSGAQITAIVRKVRRYPDLSTLVGSEDFSLTGGIYRNKEHWIKSLESYYSKESQDRLGFVVFEITLQQL